jgi:hypothetical protein
MRFGMPARNRPYAIVNTIAHAVTPATSSRPAA